MGKREKKIEAIKKYIGNISPNWPVYTYGSIPLGKARNACSSYAGAVQPKDILGLIDITITNNGKKGLLFTEHKVYYDNGFLESKGVVSYQSVSENGTIPNALLGTQYNKQALIELVSLLSKIDSETVLEKIERGIDAGNELLDVGNNFLDAITKLGDFLDRLVDDSSSKK